MAVPEDVFQKYRLAGRIAAEVREEAKKILREGMPIIEVCEKAELSIRRKGGNPAFPCNVSINEIAAHYTSPPEDVRTIPEKSIVKIDIGVHVDGYIADTATTVYFNPAYENLVGTAEAALEKAVDIIRPGLLLSRFGSEIQKTIKTKGFKPISNLTGHQIGRYLIHAGKSLPNVHHFSTTRIKAGEVYGVEPFTTVDTAIGKVKGGSEAHIFRLLKHRSLTNSYARQLLNYIKENFRTLPFTERWLEGCVPPDQHRDAFSELLSSKCLVSYPTFIEVSGKPVAQAEHTVLVSDDGCVVLT